MSYAVWDCETTTRTKFKRKASAFCADNWVVTHGFKKKGDSSVTEHRFGKQRPGPGWLRPVLEGTRLLCGFNLKFDVLHALQDPVNLDLWMEYVAGGGMIWDCQLAEFLLCGMGQADQMLSLDEVAPRYGGNIKIDEVKALWQAGVDTPDIEPELLSRYLCGGVDEFGKWQQGDVENTETVALAQIGIARERGQLASIMLNMGSLLCSIEMERNGMFIDKPLGLTLAAELEAKIKELRATLASFLPADLPWAFNWGSAKQRSAVLFGGTVYWDGHEYDCDGGGTIYSHEYEALPEAVRPRLVYSQMDIVCCTTLDGRELSVERAQAENVPVVRYSSGKREGEVKTRKVKVDNPDKPKGRDVKVPYEFQGFTEPKPAWESTADPGVYSTNADIIEELGVRDIPFLQALAALTSATKDLGTYFITVGEDGTEKGMLSLVDSLGIIHHSINHTSAVTGRFTASSPNLQNLPKGNKSQVKRVFVSRFKDGVIIQSDFTALEIYIQAILTKATQLIEDLRAGLDMHVLRLSNSPAGEGKSYAELLKLCKGYKDADGNWHDAESEWDYKRTGSKVYSFQAAYGAGDDKIADTTGIAKSLVADLRAADDARYPQIGAYFERRTAEIRRARKSTGRAVPHPEFPSVMCNLGRSTVRTPDGKVYSYMESPSPGYLVKRGTYCSFSPTEIKNYEVQGEGAEWAKAAMLLAVRAFYARKNFGGLALLVNQVHDALYADADPSVKMQAAALLHACMEAASDYMAHTFKWDIPLGVPSDTSWGKSMKDEDTIPGVKELAAVYRTELQDTYLQGFRPAY